MGIRVLGRGIHQNAQHVLLTSKESDTQDIQEFIG